MSLATRIVIAVGAVLGAAFMGRVLEWIYMGLPE